MIRGGIRILITMAKVADAALPPLILANIKAIRPRMAARMKK